MIESSEDGVILQIRVTPRSSRTKVDGEVNGALKIRLQAPPVDGKANDALIKYLASVLGVSRGAVTLVSGPKARIKRIHVRGCTVETARAQLCP